MSSTVFYYKTWLSDKEGYSKLKAYLVHFSSVAGGGERVGFEIVSQLDDALGYTRLKDIPAIILRLESEPSRLDQLVDKAMIFASRFSPQVFREKLSRP